MKTRRSSRKLKEIEETVDRSPQIVKKVAKGTKRGKTPDIVDSEDNVEEDSNNKIGGEEDDAPEILTAHDNDILRLKQLHEELSLKPKTKRRKREIIPKIDTPAGYLVFSVSRVSQFFRT